MTRDERGQSTVEFALVLPLVLLLLLALLQAGVMLRDQLLVMSAAREGAREAAVTPDVGRITSAARSGAPDLDITVSVARGTERGDSAKVTVSAKPITLPLVGRIVSGRRLTSSATMRVERV